MENKEGCGFKDKRCVWWFCYFKCFWVLFDKCKYGREGLGYILGFVINVWGDFD